MVAIAIDPISADPSPVYSSDGVISQFRSARSVTSRISLRIHPIPKLTIGMPLPVVATLMPLRFCRTMAANNRCASGCRAALPKLLLFINPNQILSWLTTRDSGAGYSPAIAAFQLLRPNRFSAPFGTSLVG